MYIVSNHENYYCINSTIKEKNFGNVGSLIQFTSLLKLMTEMQWRCKQYPWKINNVSWISTAAKYDFWLMCLAEGDVTAATVSCHSYATEISSKNPFRAYY